MPKKKRYSHSGHPEWKILGVLGIVALLVLVLYLGPSSQSLTSTLQEVSEDAKFDAITESLLQRNQGLLPEGAKNTAEAILSSASKNKHDNDLSALTYSISQEANIPYDEAKSIAVTSLEASASAVTQTDMLIKDLQKSDLSISEAKDIAGQGFFRWRKKRYTPLPSIRYYCSDSDGGKNYGIKGTATSYSTSSSSTTVTRVDACSSIPGKTERYVTEWSCAGNSLQVFDYLCPGRCDDGICVENVSAPVVQKPVLVPKPEIVPIQANVTSAPDQNLSQPTLVPEPNCIDSDGDSGFYTKGEVIQNGKKYVDYCLSTNYLNGNDSVTEYYCENGTGIVRSRYFHCITYGCKDGACIVPVPNVTSSAPNISNATAPALLSEYVKCVFNNSVTNQTCYSGSGLSETCTGKESCSLIAKGNKGEKYTWKSSCGGYAYTIMDGVDDYAYFDCPACTSGEFRLTNPISNKYYGAERCVNGQWAKV